MFRDPERNTPPHSFPLSPPPSCFPIPFSGRVTTITATGHPSHPRYSLSPECMSSGDRVGVNPSPVRQGWPLSRPPDIQKPQAAASAECAVLAARLSAPCTIDGILLVCSQHVFYVCYTMCCLRIRNTSHTHTAPCGPVGAHGMPPENVRRNLNAAEPGKGSGSVRYFLCLFVERGRCENRPENPPRFESAIFFASPKQESLAITTPTRYQGQLPVCLIKTRVARYGRTDHRRRDPVVVCSVLHATLLLFASHIPHVCHRNGTCSRRHSFQVPVLR